MDHHLRLCTQGGFINGKVAGDGVMLEGLTWEGCEFLDSVRSPEVWRRTEAAVSSLGSARIAVVAELAKGVAKALL